MGLSEWSSLVDTRSDSTLVLQFEITLLLMCIAEIQCTLLVRTKFKIDNLDTPIVKAISR